MFQQDGRQNTGSTTSDARGSGPSARNWWGFVLIFDTSYIQALQHKFLQAVLAAKVGTGNLLQPKGVVQMGLIQHYVFVSVRTLTEPDKTSHHTSYAI